MTELSPYLSPEELSDEIHRLSTMRGGQLVRYGESVEGRPLQGLRFGHRESPSIVVCAGIHGIEYISTMVAIDFVQRAVAVGLTQQADIWVLPCLNPDGYAKTWSRSGRGTVRSFRKNARGVDLNRNFPLPYNASHMRLPGFGSSKPNAPTYRGTHPLSEPETAALVDLLWKINPVASANLHSFMGTLIQPKVKHRVDHQGYTRLIDAFRSGQSRRYIRLAVPWFDAFTGELEDYQHHVMATWAICVESFPIWASLKQSIWPSASFWRFNPRIPKSWIENDVSGLIRYFEQALIMDRPPSRRAAALGCAKPSV